MVELHITHTGKSYNPEDYWRVIHESTERFETKRDAKRWLSETYGRCKRVPMYRDVPNGPPQKVGYVYGFRNADLSHAQVDKWLQQDWVEFRDCRPVTP